MVLEVFFVVALDRGSQLLNKKCFNFAADLRIKNNMPHFLRKIFSVATSHESFFLCVPEGAVFSKGLGCWRGWSVGCEEMIMC